MAKKTAKKQKSIFDPGFAVPSGMVPKWQKDEQSPATFDPLVSKYLPPIGVDPNGKPIYHAVGSGQSPYDRSNHARASYRAYADVKYAYTTAGQFPWWVWASVVGGVLLLGFAIANRK